MMKLVMKNLLIFVGLLMILLAGSTLPLNRMTGTNTSASAMSNRVDFYQVLYNTYVQNGCSNEAANGVVIQTCTTHNASAAEVNFKITGPNGVVTNQEPVSIVLLGNNSLLVSQGPNSKIISPGTYIDPTATVSYSFGVDIDGSGSGASYNDCTDYWSSSTSISNDKGTLNFDGPAGPDWGIYPFCWPSLWSGGSYSITDNQGYSNSGGMGLYPSGTVSFPFYDELVTVSVTVTWNYLLA